MNILTLDFETYFDDEYSLRKMTTEAYVRDPRFEVHGLGCRFHNGDLKWFDDPEELLHQVRDDPEIAILCHHAHFDGLILSHHYGVRPHAWLDTLSMGRLLVGNHLSLGLDSLARHFGLSGKSIDYSSFKDQRPGTLPPAVGQALAAGCLHDVALTWEIFTRLAPQFPKEEYAVVDATIRMFTEPALLGDVAALGRIWTDEANRKRALLDSLGVTAADLQSAARFVELMAAEGVDVPTKEGKAGSIPCIAKTDVFMKELLECDNERVRTLVEARLGVRSTIDQTRAERLGFMATRGPMCVYLNYAGAHTTRWSGGDKVNWQNLKRRGALRAALKAPVGHRIVKADKSQIECRLLNMLAGQMDVIERFEQGEDPYVAIASAAYGHEVYKPTKDDPRYVEMETKRGTGKQLELSCGYGAGADTIRATAARGTYGPPVKIDRDTALQWRDLYRETHRSVVGFWHSAERQLDLLAAGQQFCWSKFHFRDGKVWLPNGAPLLYPELQWFVCPNTGDRYWRYRNRKGWARLWGGSFVENLIQAIARVDMSQTLLRIRARASGIIRWPPVNLEHDAAAFIVPIDKCAQAKQIIREEFVRPPKWLPDLPLDCETTTGERYG